MSDTSSRSLAGLRQSLALAGLARDLSPVERVDFGMAALDEPLGGGIARAALHEVYAPGGADLPAATGFAAALALRAAGARPLLWVRQDFLAAEAGRLHPPGLAELGLDPAQVLLVRARDAEGVLRAGAEAARCSALGAALIEPWGEPRQLDLTASRRFALAAEASGVMTLLLRVSTSPAPSAAATRWLVRALPSRPREANAPGDPAFSLRLLRHRGGLGEREWRVEWSRERRSFQEWSREDGGRRDAAPLSRPLVSLPGDRPAAQAAGAPGWRRAG
ncbi:ImuA family protein [Bosea sp. (in: a-proteobacteria)]|uniref:ImuA family protein n=1 Tax=Bosea sp. (in: a-proteobacteria) TaxID=1871050 RepID=UPI002FC8CF12